MSRADKQAGFEERWDRMEMLATSGDRTDRKISRSIAEHLVLGCTELPRSYYMRADMALTSLLCARDSIREVAESDAEIQTESRAELYARILVDLQTELRTIREAYKNKAADECIVIGGYEAAESTSVSPLTLTTQRGPGSQEEPIDLTLEDDFLSSNNNKNTSYGELIDLTLEDDWVPSSGGESSVNFDSGYEEGTDILPTTEFSSPPRSMFPSSQILQ